MLEKPLEQGEDDVGPGVADVNAPVDGRPTGVDAHPRWVAGLERADLAAQRVVDADLAHRREGYAAHVTAGLAGSMGAVTEDFVLTGQRAALGPLHRDHLPLCARWINDPEVRCGLAYRGIANEDAELKWY